MVVSHTLFSESDIYLFQTGRHTKLYNHFGSHLIEVDGQEGCYFAVFAPAAEKVVVIGSFNQWEIDEDFSLLPRWDSSGIWEGFIPNIKKGDYYKYRIVSKNKALTFDKIDPFAFHFETPPLQSSIVWNLDYLWQDRSWILSKDKHNALTSPHAIYEVHLSSWRKHSDGNPFSYTLLKEELVQYVKEMGFTHVEIMPVMEHPYEPSWGYQVTGYFAPTSRFGSPEEFMALVDAFHQQGIGVILDWVPAHFPSDGHALSYYDGSHVYEHPDSRKGFHPDWKSLIFNFERSEIRSFLLSSAMFWVDVYHVDGVRVDAVASMLYLDYSRKEGEWEKNQHGGNQYLAAVSFIKDFNEALYKQGNHIQTIAEESTSYPGVTHTITSGGLGFGMKWMMGWMHDTINYFKNPPIHRRHHHNSITFSIMYAFSENFVLPFSHDEVVHGKASMIYKMPGDEQEKFANLRTLYGYMYAHPGAKLLFMGCEFAQTNEWNFKKELSWELLQYDLHSGMQRLVKDLNILYKTKPSLFSLQFDSAGFEWVDFSHHQASIIAFSRKSDNVDDAILVICNFDNQSHTKYRYGVPQKGNWLLIMNTDSAKYGGSGLLSRSSFTADKITSHGKVFSIEIDLPPLCVLYFQLEL